MIFALLNKKIISCEPFAFVVDGRPVIAEVFFAREDRSPPSRPIRFVVPDPPRDHVVQGNSNMIGLYLCLAVMFTLPILILVLIGLLGGCLQGEHVKINGTCQPPEGGEG